MASFPSFFSSKTMALNEVWDFLKSLPLTMSSLLFEFDKYLFIPRLMEIKDAFLYNPLWLS